MIFKKGTKVEEEQVISAPAMAMTTALKSSKKKDANTATKVIVKFDCGFANNLFIRGQGIATLTWKKGLPLKNLKADEWVFETDRPFDTAEFKILINDQQYEVGENHKLDSGSTVVCHPKF